MIKRDTSSTKKFFKTQDRVDPSRKLMFIGYSGELSTNDFENQNKFREVNLVLHQSFFFKKVYPAIIILGINEAE
jgi:hypothetical protein